MFPESCFDRLTETKIDDETGSRQKSFNSSKKNTFLKRMLKNGTKQNFAKFSELFEKIREVREA
ncbi:MAG: hypothetical protein COA85_07645 [Robiginitomaculum sp.]|nr:MAG: hypothetical protein COA85_07645 [Robiginitomaculum sp.]